MTDIEIISKALKSDKLNWENVTPSISAKKNVTKKSLRVYSKEQPNRGIDIELKKSTAYYTTVYGDIDETSHRYSLKIYAVVGAERVSNEENSYIAEVSEVVVYNGNERTASNKDVDFLVLSFKDIHENILYTMQKKAEKERTEKVDAEKKKLRDSVIDLI